LEYAVEFSKIKKNKKRKKRYVDFQKIKSMRRAIGAKNYLIRRS